MSRWMLGLVLLAACASDAEDEAKCRMLVPAVRVGECLVERFDWEVDQARRATLRAIRAEQRQADSVSDDSTAQR